VWVRVSLATDQDQHSTHLQAKCINQGVNITLKGWEVKLFL
jgi:hypothetical protein